MNGNVDRDPATERNVETKKKEKKKKKELSRGRRNSGEKDRLERFPCPAFTVAVVGGLTRFFAENTACG
jgi:hypothetical protein